MKRYEIYKHTSPDGKAYIGQTCRRVRRDYDHKNNKKITPLTTAIEIYGWDNFTHETLATDLTKAEANDLEMRLIAESDTVYPNGYNLHKGGAMSRRHSDNINQAYLIDVPFHKRRREKPIINVEIEKPTKAIKKKVEKKVNKIKTKIKNSQRVWVVEPPLPVSDIEGRKRRAMSIPKEAYYQNH